MYDGSYAVESETRAIVQMAGANLSVEALTLLLARGGGDPEKALSTARTLFEERSTRELVALEKTKADLLRNITALKLAASPIVIGTSLAELLRSNRARPRSKREEEHTLISEFIHKIIQESLEDNEGET